MCFVVALSTCTVLTAPSVVTDPRAVLTPIKVDVLENLLLSLGLLPKFDHVLESLRDGFDAGLPMSPPARSFTPKNHSTVNLDRQFISKYIDEQLTLRRYAGPFAKAVLEGCIGPFHSSPLGLVPKPGAVEGALRMIQDLSFPRNDPNQRSANSFIDSDLFQTEWGGFDDCAHLVLQLPRGSQCATFDVEAAYRNTPIRPPQQNWLVVQWDDEFYVDRVAPFGLASSGGIWGSIADCIVGIARAQGLKHCIKWVDDFLVAREPARFFSENDFTSASATFGVPWKRSKQKDFSETFIYHGWKWSIDQRSVSLTEERRRKIEHLLTHWLDKSNTFTALEAESLHGKLVHVSSVMKALRPFLRSITRFASGFDSRRAHLHAPRPLRKDLDFIRFALDKLPAWVPIKLAKEIDIEWYGDASSDWGVAAVIGRSYCAWSWNLTVADRHRLIGWAESLAIELGLRLLLQLIRDGRLAAFNEGAIVVHSDNLGVTQALAKGRSSSQQIGDTLKRICAICVVHQIQVSPRHVPGLDNGVADALSRGILPPGNWSFVCIAPPDEVADVFEARSLSS